MVCLHNVGFAQQWRVDDVNSRWPMSKYVSMLNTFMANFVYSFKIYWQISGIMLY